MATVNLNVRLDTEVKQKAEEVFKELGISTTSAITMFLKSCIRNQGLVFDMRLHSQPGIFSRVSGEKVKQPVPKRNVTYPLVAETFGDEK